MKEEHHWVASKPGKDFGFSRPGGEKTNIELNGQTGLTIGTATWPGTAPAATDQTIVLHISNQSECASLLNGVLTSTCFVLPGNPPGPYCDTITGDTNAATTRFPTRFRTARRRATPSRGTSQTSSVTK